MSYFLSYISKMLCIKIPQDGTNGEGAAPAPAECCVCLSRIRAGEATRRLPCRHSFHRDCVDRWLASTCKRTCPLCRVYVDGWPPAAAAKVPNEPLTEDLVIWFSTMLVPGF